MIYGYARGKCGSHPSSDDVFKKAMALYDTGQYTLKDIRELTGISKSVLYRAINGRKKGT